MVDPELGLAVVFNGCIYNHRELRAELEGARLPLLLHQRHRGPPEGLPPLGRRASSTGCGHVRLLHRRARQRPAVLARDRLGIKPLYLADGRGAPALRLDAAGPARRRRRRHAHRPRRAAPLPHLPRGGARAAHDPGRRAQARRPRRCSSSSPTAAGTSARTGARRSAARRRRARDWSAATGSDAVLDALRLAVERRMVADVPVGVLLSGGLDSSLIVALLAEAGQRGLPTFSIGFEAVGGREGDEFALVRPGRRALRHRPPPHPRSPTDGCCRRSPRRSRP